MLFAYPEYNHHPTTAAAIPLDEQTASVIFFNTNTDKNDATIMDDNKYETVTTNDTSVSTMMMSKGKVNKEEEEEIKKEQRSYIVTLEQLKNVKKFIRQGINQVYPRKTIFTMDILQRWIYLDRITTTHYQWWVENIVNNKLPDIVLKNGKEFHLVSITSAEQCYDFLTKGLDGDN